MPAVARVGDMCTGHGPFKARPASAGSPKTIVNGKPAIRVGDAWANHPHAGVQSTGSKTVFAEGLALARVGDQISCGSKVAAGSPDTFIG